MQPAFSGRTQPIETGEVTNVYEPVTTAVFHTELGARAVRLTDLYGDFVSHSRWFTALGET